MKYQKALSYIKDYWKESLTFSPDDDGVHIGLPHHFIQPNKDAFTDDQFYWDSFFISLGLLLHKEYLDLVKGIIENFRYLQNKYGIIPARNKFYNLGISQPPFLSSLVRAVFEQTRDRTWLQEQLPMLERELKEYWMGHHIGSHLLDNGLSRYCDHNITHITAEHESGWDMTSRFNEHCLDYAPIDLNCCLYKYEKDLAYFYRLLQQEQRSQEYEDQALIRKDLINKYCWHDEKGFYFDYNHHKKEIGRFYSLAGYYPLWSGVASEEQAHRMIAQLHRFEHAFGLATTQPDGLSKEFKQWDYPNGWANLHWIVIVGLEQYQFVDDARRIALKWLELNDQIFEQTGKFWEKYDVVTLDVGKDGRYPTQEGFGWTNAVFAWLARRYG